MGEESRGDEGFGGAATGPQWFVWASGILKPMENEVKIVQRGPLRIAAPTEDGAPLSEATVDQVLRKVRERRDQPASHRLTPSSS